MLAVGVASAIAEGASEDTAGRMSSPRAADREATLLLVGDDGLPERRQRDAVARMLADPVAAVRWNAIAALRKAGPAATDALQPLLADMRPSTHVASYDGGCGRVPFVPTHGELAGAVLAAMPDADHGPLWAEFRSADAPRRRLLEAMLLTAARAPQPAQLRQVLDAPAHERRLLLRLAPAGIQPSVLAALGEVLAVADPRRDAATERQLAEAVAAFGAVGAGVATIGLASSAFPESWLQQPRRDDAAWDAVRARALRQSGLSGRAAALRVGAEVLSAEAWRPRPPDGQRLTPPAWVLDAGPAAALAVLSQPVGGDGASPELLASAALLFVRVPEVRPILPDLLVRAARAAEASNHVHAVEALGSLAAALAAGQAADEAMRLWTDLLEIAAQFPVGSARRQGASALSTVVARLQPPPDGVYPTLATTLVQQVLSGRLPASVLAGAPNDDGGSRTAQSPPPEDARRAGWRTSLRAALPPSGPEPGREETWARLVAALGEPPERIDAAWLAVARSGRAAPADVTVALVHLAAQAATREWALPRIMLRLRTPADAAEAELLMRAAWPSGGNVGNSWSAEGWARRPAALEAHWSDIAAALPPRSAGRGYALARLLSEYRFWLRGRAWRDHVVDALGSAEGEAVVPLLSYLASRDAGADPTRQALPCSDLEWSMLPDTSVAPLGESRRGALAAVLRVHLAVPGERANLAVRVWRGQRLGADAAVDRLHAEISRAIDAQCTSERGTRTTTDELRAAMAAPEGHPGRAEVLTQAVRSRYGETVCAAVQALPAAGADSLMPAFGLLRRWTERATLDNSANLPRTCSRQRFDDAFAQALRQLGPDRRRKVLQLLLASDSSPIPGPPVLQRQEDGREGWDDARLPTWRPNAVALQDWELENSTGLPEVMLPQQPVLEALADVLSASLERRLLEGPPGPMWVALARGHWLQGKPADRRPASEGQARARGLSNEDDAGPVVAAQAGSVLPWLAPHWPGLAPALRRDLMPLLAAGPPSAPWLREMLALSAENPTAGEREAALRIAMPLWQEEAVWRDLAQAELIAGTIADRLGPVLDRVFDRLRPPAQRCMAGSTTWSRLPRMPWPPPAGYRPPQPIPLSQFGPPGLTTGSWYERVRGAFQSISPNFETGLFSGPPDGFALVARLERIDEQGSPFPDPARWTSDGQAKLDLGELLRDLFLERPGRFRIVALVVTSQPTFQSDPSARLPELIDGAQVMPKELAAQPLDGKHVLALVYPFERPRGAPMRIWRDGGPSTMQHLQAAGLWQKLQSLNSP